MLISTEKSDKEGYKYKRVYEGGVVYFNGDPITKEKQERINNVVSRCWDSLPTETKLAINKKYEENKDA